MDTVGGEARTQLAWVLVVFAGVVAEPDLLVEVFVSWCRFHWLMGCGLTGVAVLGVGGPTGSWWAKLGYVFVLRLAWDLVSAYLVFPCAVWLVWWLVTFAAYVDNGRLSVVAMWFVLAIVSTVALTLVAAVVVRVSRFAVSIAVLVLTVAFPFVVGAFGSPVFLYPGGPVDALKLVTVGGKLGELVEVLASM